jgi:CubicO group peptidase (beta-lactamase class C family)
MTRADLAGVTMGVAPYHPGWVYHGLMVGRLRDAALLLDRLLTGDLLPPDLRDEMCRAHPLDGPFDPRPWRTLGFGLGLMCGTALNGSPVLGHTGGGPGSVVAVFRVMGAPAFTAAAFALSDDLAQIEERAFSRGRP